MKNFLDEIMHYEVGDERRAVIPTRHRQSCGCPKCRGRAGGGPPRQGEEEFAPPLPLPRRTLDNLVVFRKVVKEGGKESRVPIWKLPGSTALFFRAGLAIDADGAPNAYHPKNIGIDHNANAGYVPGSGKKPYGIVWDDGNNKPYVQGTSDPFPGYFVSGTSLVDASRRAGDPRRYVDSTKTPYIALPKAFRDKLNTSLGDFAAVVHAKNRKVAFALFADSGPAYKLGEGSIALAKALGHNPYVVRNGKQRAMSGISRKDVVYIIFPKSGQGQGRLRSLAEINRAGTRLFAQWGGMRQFDALFPRQN